MKKLLAVSLKTMLVILTSIGAVIVLEMIFTPFIEFKGVKFIAKVITDLCLAFIPITLYLKIFKKAGWPLGLRDVRKASRLGFGALLGCLFMVGLIGLILIFGGMEIEGIKTDYAASSLIYLVITSYTVSFAEEILFRGVLQGLFRDAYGRSAGIVVSSVFFFVVHGANPGMFESIIAPVSLLLAGLVLALIREKTGSLWIPIGFHWTWNLFQDLSGFATSGFASDHSPLIINLVPGKEWLNGGSFGIEGSLISLIILSAACVYLVKTLPKK